MSATLRISYAILVGGSSEARTPQDPSSVCGGPPQTCHLICQGTPAKGWLGSREERVCRPNASWETSPGTAAHRQRGCPGKNHVYGRGENRLALMEEHSFQSNSATGVFEIEGFNHCEYRWQLWASIQLTKSAWKSRDFPRLRDTRHFGLSTESYRLLSKRVIWSLTPPCWPLDWPVLVGLFPHC